MQGRIYKCPALCACVPLTAFNTWVNLAGLTDGPVFRKIDRWGHVADESLHTNSLIPLALIVLPLLGIRTFDFIIHQSLELHMAEILQWPPIDKKTRRLCDLQSVGVRKILLKHRLSLR